MSARDRLRIEAHHEALRELERNLDRIGMGRAEAETCGALQGLQSFRNPAPGTRAGRGDFDHFPDVSDAFNKLVVEAFACDLTRSVVHQWFAFGTHHTWLGHSDGGHSYSHNGNQRQWGEIVNWYYGEGMKIIEGLRSTEDAGGGTLLDNTLVTFVSEFSTSKGSHQPQNMPLFFCGGENVARGERNRFLDFGDRGRTHVDFLQSIARAFGIERFGNQATSDGPVPGLFEE